MFAFNKTQFRFEYVGLKSISKSTIDPRAVIVRDDGTEARISVPAAVARMVKTRLHGTTRFSVNYPCCIAYVGDMVVAVDVAVGADYRTYTQLGEWFSVIERKAVVLENLQGDWLFDGQYVYQHVGDVQRMGETNFGTCQMRVLNLFKFGDERSLASEELAGLAYFNDREDKWVITTPVTRHSGRFLQVTGDVDAFDTADRFVDGIEELADLDRRVFPNLRFVNYAGSIISNAFHYEMIEPLGLPLLMFEHNTFNLGSLPLGVQISSHAPFSFTAGLAWMIGMYVHVTNMNQLLAVKSSLKMLLSKGNTVAVVQSVEGGEEETDTIEQIAAVREQLAALPMIKF